MRHRSKHSARSARLQYLVVAFVPAAIVTLSITGFMWAQKDVTVVEDGRSFRVATQAGSVAHVLEEAGVSLGRGDIVTPHAKSSLASGDTVIVRHAVPVTLELEGEAVEVDVVGDTVADALVAVGADPSANTEVDPPLSEPLQAGMTIEVPDVFTRVTRDETTITPEVEIKPDPTLPLGEKRVVDKGSPGRMMRVYRVLVVNGVEGEPGLSAEKVVEKPEPQVVAVGTAAPGVSPGKSYKIPEPPTSGKKMRVETTAYSPREPGLDFTTATGARARRGVIAVDPRVIPLGTRVYVPGYGYAVARDTGGAIKGNRIDLCFDTVAETHRWGRRKVTITVLGKR